MHRKTKAAPPKGGWLGRSFIHGVVLGLVIGSSSNAAVVAQNSLPTIGLASLVDATGIDRQWDADLARLAQQRSNEITTTFEHRAIPELSAYTGGEVIAVNWNASDPAAYALDGWRNSPTHWAVLTTGELGVIGCGETVAVQPRSVEDQTPVTKHYFVCLLTDRALGD